MSVETPYPSRSVFGSHRPALTMSIDRYSLEEREFIEALLAGAALDALSTQDAAQLQDYLQKDPALSLELQCYQACSVGFAANLPEAAPSPSLRAKIIAGMDATAAQTPLSLVPRRSNFPRIRFQQFAIAAGFLLLFASGLQNLVLWKQLSVAQAKLDSLRGHDTYLFALKGTPNQKTAAGIVFLDQISNRATLAFQNLGSLDPGKSYYLWALVGSKIVPCGQFRGDSSHRAIEAIPIPAGAYTEADENKGFTMIVTIETGNNVAKPSSNIVLKSVIGI